MSGKGFLGNMTENLHADCVQSRQAGFVRCCHIYSRMLSLADGRKKFLWFFSKNTCNFCKSML